MLRQAGPGKLAIQDMDKKYSFWVKKDLQLWPLTVISGVIMIYHLFMTNSLPWKDPPFFIGKPSVNGPFSMAMLNNQRV